MRLLVVEDDVRKADAISTLIAERFSGIEFEVARSYQTGLKAILSNPPNVVILDMSIPNYDAEPGLRSGKPRPLGGFELLRKIRRKRMSTRAIVLTQLDHFGDGGQEYGFAELEMKCFNEFPENFFGAIYYAQSSADWRIRLEDAIHRAVLTV